MKVIFHYDCGPWLDTQLKSLAAEGLYVEVCSEDDETRFHYLLKTCDILWLIKGIRKGFIYSVLLIGLGLRDNTGQSISPQKKAPN
jgi:hypothetical protein